MRQLVWSLIIALLIAGPAGSQGPDPYTVTPGDIPESIRAKYNDAAAMTNAGNGATALNQIKEIVHVIPNYVYGHLMYAQALEQAGKMQESMAELEVASSLSPDNQSVLSQVGRAFEISGQLDKAIRTYNRYLFLYPNADNAKDIKSAVELMRSEVQKRDIHADSRGRDNFLDETLLEIAQRWSPSCMPIPVFIHDGTGVRGYAGYLPELLKQAFVEWAQNSGGKVSFKLVNTPSSCLIECFWASDTSGMSSTLEEGETVASGTVKTLTHAKITLLTTITDSSPQRFKGVCLHEIGHALGMHGHSSDPGDIMFMFSKGNDTRANTLSARDKNTLFLIYTLSEADFARYGRSTWKFHPFLHYDKTTNEATTNFNEGAYAYNTGRLADALRLFQEAVRLSPATPEFNAMLANTYFQVARQDFKNQDSIKYQKHMELAARYYLSGNLPKKAASAYASLAEFARSMKNENDARMYDQESKRWQN